MVGHEPIAAGAPALPRPPCTLVLSMYVVFYYSFPDRRTLDLSIPGIVPLLTTVVLLWTATGAAQDSVGRSGGTTVLESAEASLELNRSERRRIQTGLAAEGFEPGPVDGLFGRGTRKAIREWQASRGEAATGYLDADAARALLDAGKQTSRSANGGGTSPGDEIRRDKAILGLSKALKADDYPKALEFIDELERIGGDLPPSVDYFRGEAYFHTERYFKAYRALNRYVATTGKKGRYYKKSLELMLDAEEKIPNARDENGHSLLHGAARTNEYDVAKELIALGVDVSAIGRHGFTPLHIAAHGNARSVAALLIEHGADVNAGNSEKAQRPDPGTPLHVAAASNARDTAALLIEHGADVNLRNGRGKTPLYVAAASNARDTAALLIEHGADVNSRHTSNSSVPFHKGGGTPLQAAAVGGSRDTAALLIEQGADLNARDDSGWTALHFAARHYARDVASLLIDRGADVNARSSYRGFTPLHVSIFYYDDRTSKSILETMALLIGRGADVNARTSSGKTLLRTANEKKSLYSPVAALLRRHGARE